MRFNKFTWAILKTIGICYYAIMPKEEKKKQVTTRKKTYENAFCPTNKTSVTA